MQLNHFRFSGARLCHTMVPALCPRDCHCLILMSTPGRHSVVLNEEPFTQVIESPHQLLWKNRTKSISDQWKVPSYTPLTSLDLSDNNAWTSLEINVASVSGVTLWSRWSKQETAPVCVGSHCWHWNSSSCVSVCCSCDKVTGSAECERPLCWYSALERLLATTKNEPGSYGSVKSQLLQATAWISPSEWKVNFNPDLAALVVCLTVDVWMCAFHQWSNTSDTPRRSCSVL